MVEQGPIIPALERGREAWWQVQSQLGSMRLSKESMGKGKGADTAIGSLYVFGYKK